MAKIYGPNILELGCGNGRVTIPLLNKGLNITGLDISNDMLNILKKKTYNMKNKPTIILDDMCNYVSTVKYDIVILAHTTLCLLKTNEERQNLFQNTFNNLRDGGIFIFNYIDTNYQNIKSEVKPAQYVFNHKKKSFVVLTEKVIAEHLKNGVNLYAEEVKKDDTINRYISYTTKYLLNKGIIYDIIDNIGFIKEKEYIFNSLDGNIIFEVIKKIL